MKFEALVKQLANRINQPHVIEHYLRMVWETAVKETESKTLPRKDICLSFEELKDEIKKYNAKNEYQQVAIVMLRTIFEAHKEKSR